MADTAHYQTLGAATDAKFKAAGAAYDVLDDPEKRAAYDRFGADWDQPQPDPTADPRGFGFDERDINPDMFREFFGQRFGGGSMRQHQHATVAVALENAITGAKQTLTMQSPQLDDAGHVTMQTRRIDLAIPKGVLPGQLLRVQGQGAGGSDLLIEVSFKPHKYTALKVGTFTSPCPCHRGRPCIVSKTGQRTALGSARKLVMLDPH